MPDTNKGTKPVPSVKGISSASSSPRLSSFRSNRDLSLPGPSAVKRVIKPNIVIRKTKKEKEIEEALQINSKTLKKADKAAFKAKSERHVKTLIQTTGSLYDPKGYVAPRNKATFKADPSPKPSIQYSQVKKEPLESLDSVQSDSGMDFLSRLNIDTSENNEYDAGLRPVDICTGKVKTEPINQELEVDANPNGNGTKSMATIQEKEVSFAEKLLSNSKEYMHFQFPALVAKGSMDEGANNPNEPQPSRQDKMEARRAGLDRFRLSSLDNGKIGTMKVYKSGKVELVMDNCAFEVCEGFGGYHNKLAYVHIDSDQKSGRMSLLGEVPNMYTFSRDFNT